MAGSGRRTFAPGEVLTASNVMNYLQDQAVMNFAGTAARGSAIGTAVAEGMVSYRQDTNDVEVYTGTTWDVLAYQSDVDAIAPGVAGIPYRTAAGTASITITSATGGTLAVTFPASRFNVAPVVQVSKTSASLAKYVPYTLNASSTAVTLGIFSGDGTTGSGTQPLAWTAIQMTSGTAVG